MVLIFNHYCRFLAFGINDIAKMQQQFRFRISGSRIVPSSQIALALSVSGSRDGCFALWDLKCKRSSLREEFCINSTGMVKGAHPSPLSKGIGRRKAASSSITSVLYLKDEITIATAGAPDSFFFLYISQCPEILGRKKAESSVCLKHLHSQTQQTLSLGDVVPWEQIKPSKNILYETCKPEKWFKCNDFDEKNAERFCRNTVKEPSDCSFLSLIFGSQGDTQKQLENQVLLYYPLDGRLTISPVGKLTVNYTEEGVVFLEAETNCKMDEIGDITKPDLETLEKLVYDVVDTKNILEVPPVTAQGMFDGIGAMEFVNSWAQVARGLSLITPYLDRTGGE
ncbi:hypothetical protein F2Q69_00062414 [Brassica cretica]|uniref:Uncharacterized protein n=1 Tax=Brassica cretica TaxID=69181 RepID=A0A8S9RT10_BRACR|nr:hypothetical protein F2Q69_00062414 [Brassica cretica]